MSIILRSIFDLYTEKVMLCVLRIYKEVHLTISMVCLDQEDKKAFQSLFEKLKIEFNIKATDELIGLERAIKNYIKILKAEKLIAKEGEIVREIRFSKEGEEYNVSKPHVLLNYINIWENQFRNWMREMRFTRKEKNSEEKVKDLAKEMINV